jgi:hypothetical protein
MAETLQNGEVSALTHCRKAGYTAPPLRQVVGVAETLPEVSF